MASIETRKEMRIIKLKFFFWLVYDPRHFRKCMFYINFRWKVSKRTDCFCPFSVAIVANRFYEISHSSISMRRTVCDSPVAPPHFYGFSEEFECNADRIGTTFQSINTMKCFLVYIILNWFCRILQLSKFCFIFPKEYSSIVPIILAPLHFVF